MENVVMSDTSNTLVKEDIKVVKKNKFSPIRFFLILLSLLLLSTSIYFTYTYYQKYTKEISELNATLSTTQEELNSTKELLNTTKADLENRSKIVDVRTVVPSGARTFTYLSSCGVGISIPDDSKTFEPVSNNPWTNVDRTWRISYHKIVANEEYANSPFIGGSEYFASLINDSEGSGYIAGLVNVQCAKNTQNDTLESLTKKYLDVVKAESIKIAKGVGESYNANSNVKDLGEKEVWGVKTKSVSITAFSVAESVKETGNIFISGGNIYYVSYASSSSNSKTIESMKGIYNSLVVFNK